jgi:ERCC4-type nuclease
MPDGRCDRGSVFIIDTREQEGYEFGPEVRTIRRALPAGDYSVGGLETMVAVERKTLEDFVSTVIRSRERFHRELIRLQDYPAACVVVEADLRDVLTGSYRSDAHPSSIVGAVMSIIVDLDIPVFFCSNRQAARLFVERYLLRCERRFGCPRQPE